jgi:hypothetical protein
LYETLRHARELVRHLFVVGDDLVEAVGDAAEQAGPLDRQAHREVAVAHGLERAQQLPQSGARGLARGR